MQKDLENQVAIVTGAARGIGATIAQRLSEKGAITIIADKDEEFGQKQKERISSAGGKVHFLKVDLSQPGEAKRIISEVENTHGAPTILVNNARSGIRTDLFSESVESWRNTLSVTLDAAFFCMQEALRVMKKQRCGAIVNVSSVASFLVSKESPSYHAAKAALSQLTRYCAVEGGPFGIRINSVVPGFIVQDEHQDRFLSADNTSYREQAYSCHPVNSVGSAEDVARTVLFLCSDNAQFITGQEIVVDGGLTIQEQSSLIFKHAHINTDKK